MKMICKIGPNNIFFQDYWPLVRKEFSQKISWFDLIDLKNIYSYVFLKDNEVVGGVSVFDKSPEDDFINQKKEYFWGEGGLYASFFVIDKRFRRSSLAKEYFSLVLKNVLKENNDFLWGVVEGVRLLKYYQLNFFNFTIKIHPIDHNLFLIKFSL